MKDSRICGISALVLWPVAFLLLRVLDVEGVAQLFGAGCFVLALLFTAGWAIYKGQEK